MSARAPCRSGTPSSADAYVIAPRSGARLLCVCAKACSSVLRNGFALVEQARRGRVRSCGSVIACTSRTRGGRREHSECRLPGAPSSGRRHGGPIRGHRVFDRSASQLLRVGHMPVPLHARPGSRRRFLPCNIGACRPRADFESGERIRLRSSLVAVPTTRLTRHFNAAF